MDKKEIIGMLEQLFQEVLKKGAVVLTEESTASDVDGWDSLTNMLLISAIEKKFGIKFGFREIIKMKNVGDLCNAIICKTA
jgi:acyl carrier protein